MQIDNKLLAVALISLLAGGGAVSAWNALKPTADTLPAQTSTVHFVGSHAGSSEIHAPEFEQLTKPRIEMVPIVDVKAVTRSERQYASVLSIEPVTEQVSSSRVRQECHDVPVTQRLPERDGDMGGTVVGAVIGGLAGNQLGKGKGRDRRRIETVAGAVGGAFLGRHIDQRHVGGQVVQTMERQCHTVNEPVSRSQVVAYEVTVRNPDGSTAIKRMQQRPGARIELERKTVTEGYDVTYELDGQTHVIRMPKRPSGSHLKLVDGEVQANSQA